MFSIDTRDDENAQGAAGFADCHIGRANARDGAETTLTFDKSLRGSTRFEMLED